MTEKSTTRKGTFVLHTNTLIHTHNCTKKNHSQILFGVLDGNSGSVGGGYDESCTKNYKAKKKKQFQDSISAQ